MLCYLGLVVFFWRNDVFEDDPQIVNYLAIAGQKVRVTVLGLEGFLMFFFVFW